MKKKGAWLFTLSMICFASNAALAQNEAGAPQYGMWDGNPGVMYKGSHNTAAVIEYVRANGQPAFRILMWVGHVGFPGYITSGLLTVSASGLAYQASDPKHQSDSFQLSRAEMADAKVGAAAGGVTIEGRTKGKSFKIYVSRSTNDDIFNEPHDGPVAKFVSEILTNFESAVADFQKGANLGREALAALTPEQAAAKIQELQSEIAAAENRAQNDDQQSAAMQQQGDQAGSQGGVAGTVGQTAAYAAAVRFRDVAQSERQKIATMNQQLQQLQQQIAAVQAPPPAPAASAPADAPIAKISALDVAAAFAMQSGGVRNQPAPSRPPASGPSLADTMKFVQDKLSEQGKVNFVSYVTDGTSANPATFQFTEALSNVVADPASCRISYHFTSTANGAPAGNVDVAYGAWEIEKVDAMPAEQFFKLAAAKAGHPELGTQLDPPISTMRLQLSGGAFAAFAFYDAALADRMAKALTHASELCGGGSKDPF